MLLSDIKIATINMPHADDLLEKPLDAPHQWAPKKLKESILGKLASHIVNSS